MKNENFKLRNVEFKNRVFVASGTFGYGDDVPSFVEKNKIGAIVTKSLSLKPRDGNPPTRITEVPAGMINSIGLANIGIDNYIKEKIPKFKKLKTKIIANIAAGSIEEYKICTEKLNPFDEISAFEINLSCPNVKEGGMSFGTNEKLFSQVAKEVRKSTEKPIILKLTPNVTHISDFAKIAESEGADAISCVNTFVGMSVNIYKRSPKISTVTGGVSGPAIKPLALAKVFECVKSVKIPVIGIGGISTFEDALEFFIVGAEAIQIGTANFINPNVSVSIIDGIKKYCKENKIKDFKNIISSLNADLSKSVLQTWL